MLEDAQTTAFVGATDLDRAHDFYGHRLGLEVIERTDFATVYDGGGTPIRVTQVDEPVAADYTVLGWVVSDIGGALAALVARASGSSATRASCTTKTACGRRRAGA